MIKILIAEDNAMCRDGLKAFLDLSGYDLDVKYASSFDDAMGYLAERFDIVCCDYFLEPTHLSAETGLVFLKKYCGNHGTLKQDSDEQIIILYSGAVDEIPKGQGFYCIDREALPEVLLKKIRLVAMQQGAKVESISDKEYNAMKKPFQPQWLTAGLAIFIAVSGAITAFAVQAQKVRETEAKVITLCAEKKESDRENSAEHKQMLRSLTRIETKLESLPTTGHGRRYVDTTR